VTRLVGIEAIENAIGTSTMAGRVTQMGFALGDAAQRIEELSEFELRRPIDRDLVILEFLGGPSHPPPASTAGSPFCQTMSVFMAFPHTTTIMCPYVS
jgi:hypothetical protein